MSVVSLEVRDQTYAHPEFYGEALLDPQLSAQLLRRRVDEAQKKNEKPAETSLDEPGERGTRL